MELHLIFPRFFLSVHISPEMGKGKKKKGRSPQSIALSHSSQSKTPFLLPIDVYLHQKLILVVTYLMRKAAKTEHAKSYARPLREAAAFTMLDLPLRCSFRFSLIHQEQSERDLLFERPSFFFFFNQLRGDQNDLRLLSFHRSWQDGG